MSDELHHSELGLPAPQPENPPARPVRHVKTPDQKLAALQAQIAKAQEEIRRYETHRKVILGGACIAVLRSQPTDVLTFKRVLWESLSAKDQETVRELF